jgi:hypothetical protein
MNNNKSNDSARSYVTSSATMIVTDFQTARSTIQRMNEEWSIDRELELISPMYG